MKNCVFMNPFFKLTAKINESIQKNLFKKQYNPSDAPANTPQTPETEDKKEE